MDDSTFVSAYKINGNVVYAKVVWLDNEKDLFKIELHIQNNWWTGSFTKKSAESYKEQVDEEDYIKNVKTILMNKQNMCKYAFSPAKEDTATFSWKRIWEEDGTVTLHGSVPVDKVEELKIENPFIDFLLNENQKLKKAVENYELNIYVIKTELEQSKSELEKFVNVKTSLERSVYGKFISLLNNKKRRIQVLERNIQELENGN